MSDKTSRCRKRPKASKLQLPASPQAGRRTSGSCPGRAGLRRSVQSFRGWEEQGKRVVNLLVPLGPAGSFGATFDPVPLGTRLRGRPQPLVGRAVSAAEIRGWRFCAGVCLGRWNGVERVTEAGRSAQLRPAVVCRGAWMTLIADSRTAAGRHWESVGSGQGSVHRWLSIPGTPERHPLRRKGLSVRR